MAKTYDEIEAAKAQLDTFRTAVKYDTRDYSIEMIIDKFNRGDLFAPDYQRKYIWQNNEKSYFIESVLLGLPISIMFLGKCGDGKMEIVDGVQRITTLVSFAQDKLRLNMLKKLNLLNGFLFSDLSMAHQTKFLHKSLRVIVLTSETDDAFRQDIYMRMNRSGTIATDSEFRRGT